MPVVQTDYSRTMARGIPGDKASASPDHTNSYIVEDANGLPFGVAAKRGSTDDSCEPGAEYLGELLGTVDGALSDSATTLTLNSPGIVSRERFYNAIFQVDSEFMLLTTGSSATSLTVIRGVLGTTAAAHADNAEVRLATHERWATNFLGIARTDRTKTSTQGDRYVQSRVAGVADMGDFYTRVIDAVAGGDAAMVRLSDGRFTKRTLPVPVEYASVDAFFDNSAAAGGVATLCLQGEQGRAQN